MTGPLTSITVGTGEDAHEVVVGHGVVDAVVSLLGESVQRVLVVHASTLAVWAQQVADTARAAGLDAYLAVVPDAEEAKSAPVAAELWGALGQAGFTRTDAVVGVGGGTVTDSERSGQAYELEVTKDDGSQVDVLLDGRFTVVSVEPDHED